MKDLNVSALYDYDQYLLGNRPRLCSVFFEEGSPYSPSTPKDSALDILRYAVEDLLRWTPKMMVEMFNGQVIKDMKLETVISTLNREFPVQLDKKKDYYWYAHLLYPEQIPLTDDYLTIKAYKDVLNGKDKQDSKASKRLPKGFLEGDEGEGRIRLCLQYYLNSLGVNSIRGLYYDFAVRGNKILTQAGLNQARRQHYELPIDFLHVALPEAQRDEFYYHFYKFKALNQKSKKSEKPKRHRKKAE